MEHDSELSTGEKKTCPLPLVTQAIKSSRVPWHTTSLHFEVVHVPKERLMQEAKDIGLQVVSSSNMVHMLS